MIYTLEQAFLQPVLGLFPGLCNILFFRVDVNDNINHL